MESIPVKRCTRCGSEYPATRDHFRYQKRGVYGLHSHCKGCAARESRERYHAKGPAPVPAIGTRRCTGCKQEFAATRDFFSPSRLACDGLRAKCKRCTSQDHSARRIPKPRKPRSNPQAKTCTKCGMTHPATPEYFSPLKSGAAGVRSICKPCMSALAAQYSKDNPEWARAKARLRRVRKLAAGGTHGIEDVRKQLGAQNEKCYWCKKPLKLSGKGIYHVDHLIPLTRGGSDGPENIVCACPSCNTSRNNKLPHEWTNRLL